MNNKVKDSFFGFCVGDALGVPVEFLSRETISKNPVISMREYGTHNQPPGTWSDDSSLAFCLAESLLKGYDLNDIANNFVKWYNEDFWTPHGNVFDVGVATSIAITNFQKNRNPYMSGGKAETDNGNGSLMRILPLIFYIKDKPIEERFKIVSEVSGITHAHIRSVLGCFIYTEFALQLLSGLEKYQAYKSMQETINKFLNDYQICSIEEINRFHRILENSIMDYEIRPIYKYEENEISSGGYVLHTLEASIWCFLITDNYSDSVLKAVNLGSDTDTTGCVTGGLSGLYYSLDNIPAEWIDKIVRKNDITSLADKLNTIYCKQ